MMMSNVSRVNMRNKVYIVKPIMTRSYAFECEYIRNPDGFIVKCTAFAIVLPLEIQ